MRRRKRAVIASVVVVVVVVAVAAGLYAFHRSSSSSPLKKFVRGGGGGGDSNAISIYAPSELSKPLQLVTTTFQQENPGTTFQFTLGPSADLKKRMGEGETPNLYIDSSSATAQMPPKARPASQPAAFGYDWVQLAVAHGNPKGVHDLGVFGGGDLITGICAPELLCGKAGAQALQGAGVTAAPKVVTSNVGELTDGLKSGRIDAVLLLRTDLRSVLTSIRTPPIPPGSNFRVDYQMLQLRRSGPSDQFIQWVEGSPSARHALRFSGMLSFYDG